MPNINVLRNLTEPVIVARGEILITLHARTGIFGANMNDEKYLAFQELLKQSRAIDSERGEILADIDRDLRHVAELAPPPESAWDVFRKEAPTCLQLMESEDDNAKRSGANLLHQMTKVLLAQSPIQSDKETQKRVAAVQKKIDAATEKTDELRLQTSRNLAQRLLFLVDSWDLTEGSEETMWPLTEENLLSLRHTGLLEQMSEMVEAMVFA
jgi:hypothetical protein